MSDKTSLEYNYAHLHMRRALRPFARSKAFLVAVVLPPEADEDKWKDAAKSVLSDIVKVVEVNLDDDEYRDFRRATRAANSVDFFEVESKGKKIVQRLDPMAGLVFGDVRTVGLVRRHEVEELMSYPSVAILDAVIDIPAVDPAIVQRVARDVFGAEISRKDAEDIIALPLKLRESIRRTGRQLTKALARLREANAKALSSPAPLKNEGPYLEHLHGYGAAKEWGLQLLRDIADYSSGKLSWDDVDRGLLLSGPPGTGKTTFARALANSCGIRLLTGSYSSWQSAGHQGEMLRAMKRTFDAARESAPSILLIDEIDNFVDREKEGPHAEYMRGCVNGLLEQLDGADELTGVVVIGACNHPGNVDPAVCRPGRLDRHIELSLPDAAARREILRYHLRADIDVEAVLGRTEGASGAELERIARDARRIARRGRMPVSPADVVAALPELKLRSPEEIRIIVIHELGHAVVSAVIGTEVVKEVVITKDFDPVSNVGGYTLYEDDTRRVHLRDYYADKMTGLLGGLAAEEVIFGSHSDGVRSDLLTSTHLATLALGTLGMGDILVSDGAVAAGDLTATRLRSYELDRRVNKLLHEMRDRAVGICRQYRDVIETLSCRLEDVGRLDGAEVVAAIREFESHQPTQLALVFAS